MDELTYKAAGVDIDRGDALVKSIRGMAKSANRAGVLGDIGGFGGLFRLNAKRYKDPVLVSSTDGVGTKLKIAQRLNQHDTIGIDLVAMCVNDVVVTGAEPLFFLDYLATGKLESSVILEILKGIVKGCKEAGCALIGGETAEMPDFYGEDQYDLAGFSVGAVEKTRIIDGKGIKTGDVLVGIPSSGIHSNGLSLARRVILEKAGLKLEDAFQGGRMTIGEELLRPTRIYVKLLLDIIKRIRVRGIIHVTGGGLTGNLPRILPKHLSAVIHGGTWKIPPVFPFIQKEGKISDSEMRRVFNMGIGMVLIMEPGDMSRLRRLLSNKNEPFFIIGEVAKKKKKGSSVIYA